MRQGLALLGGNQGQKDVVGERQIKRSGGFAMAFAGRFQFLHVEITDSVGATSVGGTAATSPGNKSLPSSSDIPHDKSAYEKNRSKFRDLNSHLIPRIYPHSSEV